MVKPNITKLKVENVESIKQQSKDSDIQEQFGNGGVFRIWLFPPLACNFACRGKTLWLFSCKCKSLRPQIRCRETKHTGLSPNLRSLPLEHPTNKSEIFGEGLCPSCPDKSGSLLVEKKREVVKKNYRNQVQAEGNTGQ